MPLKTKKPNKENKNDEVQQNSKCRLYGKKDGTIDPIVSECSKLAQK